MTNIKDLITEREDLASQLKYIDRQIEDAQNAAWRMDNKKQYIAERYANGEYVVSSFNRMWWVDANGELLELFDQDYYPALAEITDKVSI
jgi:hypothetical protein